MANSEDCNSPLAIRPLASRLLQRRLQILDQIVLMFKPGRESDKAFADPEFGARLRRQPLMRGGGGMGDEALGVAEIVGNPRYLQRVEAAERGRLAALDLEADQRRSAAHLLLDQGGLWMIGAAGIDQPRDFWVSRQRICDLRGGVGLGAHAHCEGLQSFQKQPGAEPGQRWAGLTAEVVKVVGNSS